MEKPSNQPAIIIRPRKGWWDLDWRELWEYRELLYFFVWRDIKVRYKQTALGVAWAIIQPFMTMVVFSLFFGLLAKIPSNGLPYPVFYYSALLPWMYFSNSLSYASSIVVQHRSMITKVYFPRIILPISSVLVGIVDFLIAFSILLAMMALYNIQINLKIMLIPLFLLLSLLTALSVGIWFAALNAIYRDIQYIVPFIIQFWMFASPVAYPSSIVPEKWQWLYGLNPMAGVIEGFRWVITGQGHLPDLLPVSILVVFILLMGGLIYFQKLEGKIADWV
ncbi:MAG: ABC transporter permease [Bacteroidota bacterium]|nr:ABC transporter permease [Rhodothermia bacterium]MDW8285014.1 ABC transporter permease [Bacteroidota bacterium]